MLPRERRSGRFFEESEVSEFVGDDHWIPTQRFEVVQKNKVRGVDSATSNGINMATVVTEKLELPSYTDANVAVIKWLRSRLPDKARRGWVLDERRAYRPGSDLVAWSPEVERGGLEGS